jgi:hypothetical protein
MTTNLSAFFGKDQDKAVNNLTRAVELDVNLCRQLIAKAAVAGVS